jgi:hypothetical protein
MKILSGIHKCVGAIIPALKPKPKPPTTNEKLQEAVSTVAKGVFIAVGSAAALYLGGQAYLFLATAIGGPILGAVMSTCPSFIATPIALCAESLVILGLVVSELGKFALLTMFETVSLVAYELPKWVVTQGLPNLASGLQAAASSIVGLVTGIL